MKPIIGIICDYNGVPGGNCQCDNYNFVEIHYIQKIINAGGIPLLIPVRPTMEVDIPDIINKLDGLMLIGGGDIHPSFYGEEPHIKLGKFDQIRDKLEIAFTKYCINKGIPILGICRGLQVINVAAGGTLYQDIYSQRNATIQHAQKTLENFGTHYIDIVDDNFLFDIFGSKGFVNSHHHQGIKDLAKGFNIIASSRDGVIESITNMQKNIIAVQWHPELMDNRQSQEIFNSFIDIISMCKEKIWIG